MRRVWPKRTFENKAFFGVKRDGCLLRPKYLALYQRDEQVLESASTLDVLRHKRTYRFPVGVAQRPPRRVGEQFFREALPEVMQILDHVGLEIIHVSKLRAVRHFPRGIDYRPVRGLP